MRSMAWSGISKASLTPASLAEDEGRFIPCMLQKQVDNGVARAVVVSVRNALHSPTALWEIDPVGEHLTCRVRRSLAARTVA